jgi:hypothetical protein
LPAHFADLLEVGGRLPQAAPRAGVAVTQGAGL